MTTEEVLQLVKDANTETPSKSKVKAKAVLAAPPAPPVVTVVTVISEVENGFLEEIKEEIRYGVGESRVPVLKGIVERVDAILRKALNCEVAPAKANGHAVVPFPDHGLKANAERIVQALNLVSMGTTADMLVQSVELFEQQNVGMSQ